VAGGGTLDEPGRNALRQQASTWTHQGIRVLAVATRTLEDTDTVDRDCERDLVYEGLLTFLDRPKEGVSTAITDLAKLGVAIKLITGDSGPVARHVAASVGLPNDRVLSGQQLDELHDEALWHAAELTDLFVEVDPNQKERIIHALQKTGHVVGYLGDGINDAPALAAADVGIAMGTGTDVAMAAGHVTLVKGDLRGIARARQLSQATVTNMKQNLGFALVYNALGVPLAAGVLYPFFGLLLSPLIAALAMSLSSVSVVGNALRLRTQ